MNYRDTELWFLFYIILQPLHEAGHDPRIHDLFIMANQWHDVKIKGWESGTKSHCFCTMVNVTFNLRVI